MRSYKSVTQWLGIVLCFSTRTEVTSKSVLSQMSKRVTNEMLSSEALVTPVLANVIRVMTTPCHRLCMLLITSLAHLWYHEINMVQTTVCLRVPAIDT